MLLKRLLLTIVIGTCAVFASSQPASAEPQESTYCGAKVVHFDTQMQVCLVRDSINMNVYIEIFNASPNSNTYTVKQSIVSSNGTVDCGSKKVTVPSNSFRRAPGCSVPRHAGFTYSGRGSWYYNLSWHALPTTPTVNG